MSATPYYSDDLVTLFHGDAETIGRELAPKSVQTIVTSPPYFGLRDYGVDGQLGAERSVQEYIDRLVSLFHVLRDALADDGTLWLNLGDSYSSAPPGNKTGASMKTGLHGGRVSEKYRETLDRAQGTKSDTVRSSGLPAKNLIGIPWRVAFALQSDSWLLRSDIIWEKSSAMPESVKDRPSRSHEHIFLFAKKGRYFYDAAAIAEPGVAGDRGSRFDTGKTAKHQLGRSQKGTRPQFARAVEIAESAGLTEAHYAAMRAVGMSDAGKAQTTQSGFGKNDPEVQRLADEAKEVLGGYYREFLSGGTVNKRDVWRVPTVPFPGEHFAVFPPELIRPCILAGSRRGDTVLDPFSGSGTTGMVATQEGRRYIGIDLNREYLDLSLRTRFQQPVLDMTGGAA